jgi:Host cell surface-exposed lipoprotein
MSTIHDDPTQILTPPPGGKPRKKWHQRWSVRVPALGVAGLIAIIVGVGGSHPAPTAHTAPASSAPASPAKPAQPATASDYLTAHGYTVVKHFSRTEWLAKLTPGTAYAKYVAAGSDVAADGLKGSKVEFAIKVSDPAAAATVATGSMTLDGTYLVSSMTMPTTSPSASSPAPAAPASSAPAQQAPAQQAPVSQPATAPAGPTVSQQQALESAQSYLDLGSGFSRAGLIAQLDSPYGGKFSVADATWAADHSGADWDAQAVLAAKGYMQLGGFSRASLIDQLDSPYGGQFTLAQATYAANQVGL